jgi:hypothetical protein
MKLCRPIALVAVLASIAHAQPTTAPAAAPAADPIAAMAWTLGTWTLDGKWANGNPIRGVATYEPAVGAKFIVVRTQVEPAGGGTMAERDVMVYGVQDGRLTQWTFAENGTVRVVPATPTEDGSLYFEWTKPAAGTSPAVPLRLRISRDGDALRWTQQFVQKKGDWHTVLDARFVRASASTTRPAGSAQ